MPKKDDTFARRLQEMLKQLNITQQDLSNETGIDKGLISKYINGKSVPSVSQVAILVEPFNVNPVWLMGYDIPMINVEKKTTDKIAKLVSKLTESEKEQLYNVIVAMFPDRV